MNARIFFIKAREANKAIVFRRGPTDWIQMSVWDLDTDILEFGQWINKKVPMRNCDVSPSGKYVIYYVDNSEHMNCRTIISKAPYWTALTAWEHGDALFDSGGGLFESEKSILLNLSDRMPLDAYPAPSDLKIRLFHSPKEYNLWKGQINLLHEHRLEMNGWAEQDDPEFIEQETEIIKSKKMSDWWLENYPICSEPILPKLWSKRITNSTELSMITFYHSQHRKNFDLFYLVKKKVKMKLDVEWADIDSKNRIIATKEGKLLASKIAGDGSVDYTNLEILHDLNTQVPKRVLTPLEMKNWD